MQTLRILAFIGAIAVAGVGFSAAFAQDGEIEDLAHGHYLAFLSFIAAGLFYSASGWAKKLRVRLSDGSNEPFDVRKLAKSVAVGVFLGIAAFIYTAYEGEAIAVNSLEEFLPQIGVNIAFILAIDKLILGQAGGKLNPSSKIDLGIDPNDEIITDDPPRREES